MNLLKYLVVNGVGPQPQDTSIPGVPPILKRGYVQFQNGTYSGRLHPIRFQQQLFLPEFNAPTGYTVWTPPWNNGTVNAYTQAADDFSISNTLGVLNWIENNVPGLNNAITYNQNTSPAVRGGGIDSLPAPAPAGGEVISPPAVVEIVDSAKNNNSKTAFWLGAIQYAAEIAQSTVQKNMAADEDSAGPFTQGQMVGITACTVRWVQIYLPGAQCKGRYQYSAIPGASGKPELPIYGYFAFSYGGILGPLHYLNSSQVYAEPEMVGATDVYVNTIGNLSWQVTYGKNADDLQAMETSTGQLGWLAGQLQGLVPL
jgi:hypothetical protein